MRRVRVLVFVALLPVHACVLSEEPVYYPLEAGAYDATWDAVTENSCFLTGLPVPRQYVIHHQVRLDEAALEITWPQAFAPLSEMHGDVQASGRFEANENAALVVTSSCSVEIAAAVAGVTLSPGLVGFHLRLDFDAGTTAGNGQPSDCSGFEGATVNNFPFPTLSNPASGRCTLRVKGLAWRPDGWS